MNTQTQKIYELFFNRTIVCNYENEVTIYQTKEDYQNLTNLIIDYSTNNDDVHLEDIHTITDILDLLEDINQGLKAIYFESHGQYLFEVDEDNKIIYYYNKYNDVTYSNKNIDYDDTFNSYHDFVKIELSVLKQEIDNLKYQENIEIIQFILNIFTQIQTIL